jgi:hypothetical protein
MDFLPIVGNNMEYCSFVESKEFNVVSSGFSMVRDKVHQLFE